MSPLPAALRARIPSVVDRVYVRPLPDDPKRAAMVSLQNINALVRDGARDPLVRATAARILSDAGVAPTDRPGVLSAIHDWIQGHMSYERDPRDIEMLTEARKTLEAIAVDGRYAEDCDGMVIAEASMLRAVLGPANVRHVIIKGDKRSPTDWSHIFLQAHDGRAWVTLDPIMNGDAPERPKKPIGWHPPKYYGRAVADPGTGPGWRDLAARSGFAVYQRGPDMTYDLIPAQKERGNAIAYEDDRWMERLPKLDGYGAVMSGDYAQERGLPKRTGMGAVAAGVLAEAALAARASRPAPRPVQTSAMSLWQRVAMAFRAGTATPRVQLPVRGSPVPPGLYRAPVAPVAAGGGMVARIAALLNPGANDAAYQAYRSKPNWKVGERMLSYSEWSAQMSRPVPRGGFTATAGGTTYATTSGAQMAAVAPAATADAAMVARMVQGAPQSGTVLAPLEGFGAILSHRFSQGHIPGYRPTTVGEDPRAAENRAYWEGTGTVGGALASHALKTQLYRGGAYLHGYGDTDVASTVKSLAETIVQTGAQVASLQQLNELNRARIKAGQPPLSPDQAGLAAPAAHPLGVPPWLWLVGLGVAGAGAWAFTRRGRRRR